MPEISKSTLSAETKPPKIGEHSTPGGHLSPKDRDAGKGRVHTRTRTVLWITVNPSEYSLWALFGFVANREPYDFSG